MPTVSPIHLFPSITVVDETLGTPNDDMFVGDALNNALYGGSGGNDTLIGGGGDDAMIGGTGAGNSRLLGGDGDDQGSGTSGNDQLFGNGGNDVLSGKAGNDLLRGQGGDDVLQGGQGEDQLYGGQGNDTLVGGGGDDLLFGGAGNDIFKYTDEHINGDDTIFGFEAGLDKIELQVGDTISMTNGNALIDGTEAVDLNAAMAQVGANTVITLSDGGTITLVGVNEADILANLDDYFVV